MRSQIETIIKLSRNAETDQNWEEIDQKIQKLTKIDPNAAGKFVLSFANDDDSRVRDTTASILEFLDLSDSTTLTEATEKMIIQATQDEDIFASGRAVTFLLKHAQNPFLKAEIEPSLENFSKRAITNNWQEELKANIPNQKLHQLLIKNK